MLNVCPAALSFNFKAKTVVFLFFMSAQLENLSSCGIKAGGANLGQTGHFFKEERASLDIILHTD